MPTWNKWYSRPVLFVGDVHRSLRFYVDKLGFTTMWHEADGQGTVAQVERGGCEIILCAEPERAGTARLFIELTSEGLRDLTEQLAAGGVASERM